MRAEIVCSAEPYSLVSQSRTTALPPGNAEEPRVGLFITMSDSPAIPRITHRTGAAPSLHGTNIMESRVNATRKTCVKNQCSSTLRACLGVIIGFAFVNANVLAQPDGAYELQLQPESDTPWDPDAILAIGDYVASPSFNNRRYYIDHFAGPSNADQVGGVAAELSNGDIVVAGLVPNFQTSGTCNNGTALCNLGLVRYNRHGVRLAWSDPNGFGFYSNNYLIYPNNAASGFQYIRDVKVQNGTIYVLVDVPNLSQAGLGRQNINILSFSENGRPRGSISVFGLSSNASDQEDFYGAQMSFTGPGKLIVTATDYDGTSSYLAVSRLNIDAGGGLGQDTTWGSSYAGSGNRIIRYPANVPYTVNYATTPVGFSGQRDFYVSGSLDAQGDSDVIVLKISSVTGSYKPEFGGNGFASVDFARPNSTHDDYAGGLYVYRDDVYLAARVDEQCLESVGVAKLNGVTGGLVSAFGTAGKIAFGGFDTPCAAYRVGATPTAISATGGRIGVVGIQRSWAPGGPSGFDNYDPYLAVIDAVTGSVIDEGRRIVIRPDGTRAGDAVFYSVIGGPDVLSPFIAVGNSRDTLAGNTLSYLTGMFIPDSDLIFANNFD